MSMRRVSVREVTNDLLAWWDSETPDFQDLVLRVLASLPGGESLEDVEPMAVSWTELTLLANLFSALTDEDDVRYVVSKLYEV